MAEKILSDGGSEAVVMVLNLLCKNTVNLLFEHYRESRLPSKDPFLLSSFQKPTGQRDTRFGSVVSAAVDNKNSESQCWNVNHTA